LVDDGRIQIRIKIHTNNDGSGTERPKNLRIRISTTPVSATGSDPYLGKSKCSLKKEKIKKLCG
jgi:hypothetical protein